MELLALPELAAALNLPSWSIPLLIVAAIWALVWKGIALWKSARLNQPIWFVILLVVNTVGLLEILYIFLFSEIKLSSRKAKVKRARR